MLYAFQLQQFEARLYGEGFPAICLRFPLVRMQTGKPVQRHGCAWLLANLL